MYAWNACKMTEKTDHWTWFKIAIVINICLRLCYNTFHYKNIIRLIYSSRNKVLTKKKITTNKHSHIALWFDVCVRVHEWRVRPYVCECYFSHIINKIKNIIILNSEHYIIYIHIFSWPVLSPQYDYYSHYYYYRVHCTLFGSDSLIPNTHSFDQSHA